MGEKSDQKRQLIVETARNVFRNKGFKNVTMKDIVESCDISRGGLYLYFSSTSDVFEAVLELEKQETDDIFTGKITSEDTITDILALFLKEQKKEIMSKKKSLAIAIYEYYFDLNDVEKEHMLRKQFDMGVKGIEALIQSGIERGEFECENPLAMARNIMFIIEGLKISSYTMNIAEEIVDEELLFILQGLIIEE